MNKCVAVYIYLPIFGQKLWHKNGSELLYNITKTVKILQSHVTVLGSSSH